MGYALVARRERFLRNLRTEFRTNSRGTVGEGALVASLRTADQTCCATDGTAREMPRITREGSLSQSTPFAGTSRRLHERICFISSSRRQSQSHSLAAVLEERHFPPLLNSIKQTISRCHPRVPQTRCSPDSRDEKT